MHFNAHLEIPADAHAFLSPSGYSWLNYNEDKLIQTWQNSQAAKEGTELHALAAQLIKKRIRVKELANKNFAHYVNDGISYNMTPEVTLKYSKYCFGHADTIALSKDSTLRIHDLKTGITKAKIEQLQIYAALFCLEYDFRPGDLNIILRLYQYEGIEEQIATPEIVAPIMDTIIRFDKILTSIEEA